MRCYARWNLVDHAQQAAGGMLLEGRAASRDQRWIEVDSFHPPDDESIDEEASRLVAQLGHLRGAGRFNRAPHTTFAWLNALRLRYLAVKLLRTIDAWEHAADPRKIESLVLAEADDDYARLAKSFAASRMLDWKIERQTGAPALEAPYASSGMPRRLLGRWATRVGRSPFTRRQSRSTAYLLGNSRRLESVARALSDRCWQIVWIADRLPLRAFLPAMLAGQNYCICDSECNNECRFDAPNGTLSLSWRNIDLGPALAAFLTRLHQSEGARQTCWLDAIDQTMHTNGPGVLVVDEDATPLARAAVAVARARQIKSIVVQHGAPCVRFGFAPLAADRFCAWGEPSRKRLVDWGLSPERIRVCGSAWHEEWLKRLEPRAQAKAQRDALAPRSDLPRVILFLNTVPPRPERPDAVALGLHEASYEAMLRRICRVLGNWPNCRLVVRPHPRAQHDAILERVLSEHADRSIFVERDIPLEGALSTADVVISCASSAGADAALAGWPVVQLCPQGAHELLPAGPWEFVASATSDAELATAIVDAHRRAFKGAIGANWRGPVQILERPSCQRIADAIEELMWDDRATPIPAPHAWNAKRDLDDKRAMTSLREKAR